MVFNNMSTHKFEALRIIEINTCKAYLELIPKIIDFPILNKDGITDNLFGKIYVKQDFKNFEKIEI